MRALEILFTPAEFRELAARDLSRTTCVVFDVLRATSTMLEALAQGAEGILPATDIPEALRLGREHPGALLAGERGGLRIRADLAGVDFDLGNSPREFDAGRVAGRVVVMTTTNGTRALTACRAAREVMASSFANIGAVAARIAFEMPEQLILVCAGTEENAAFEDVLGTGALVDRLWPHYEDLANTAVDDSAVMARSLFLAHRKRPEAAAVLSRNGRRLLANPDLAADVPLCFALDRLDLLAVLGPDGVVRAAGD